MFRPNMNSKYDTIVVGMGAAGVTAASTLAKAGRRVLGLEADNRIGGRVKTVPFGEGVVELGAEWIHGTVNSRVYDAAVQQNVATLEQSLTSEVFRSDGSFGNRDLFNELTKFCIEIVEESSDHSEPLGQYVTAQLMEYLKKNHPDVLKDQDFINEFLETMNLFTNNHESSNDWNDVTTQTTYEVLEGHLHTSWHKHGYKTFFEILLNKYNNGSGWPSLDIKLNKEVTQIKWPKVTTGNVEVVCKDGERFIADNVIVTVSLGVLKERYQTFFSPMLPPDKIIAIDKISFGVNGKIILSFPSKWLTKSHFYLLSWRKKDIKKLPNDHKWLAKIGPTVTFPMGAKNTLTIWTSNDVTKMEKIEMIQTIPIGVMDKVILKFDQPWWTSIPYTFMFFLWKGQDKKKVSDEDYWTTRIFGCSTPMGSKNALTLWTSGEVGKLVETLPEEIVMKKSVELLRKFMGANFTIPEPTGIVRSTWFSNPFTRGSYSYDNLVMPQHPNARSTLREPLVDAAGTPRVLFAGEATDLTHFSTVHGASDSGYREAARLLPNSKI